MSAKVSELQPLIEDFKKFYGKTPRFIVRAPGRVNLLGEHIDYNGGTVLPVAIDRAIYILFREGQDKSVSIISKNINEKTSFSIEGLKTKTDLSKKPLPSWALYPAGVAWSFKGNGFPISGINALVFSDLPMGSGLSSSAAFEVGFASALKELGGWELDPLKMALLCQRAENEYVGAMCGVMDQFASIFGRENHTLFLDCQTLKHKLVKLPKNVSIVVADTGIRRELGKSGHNLRRTECEKALGLLKKRLPKINSLSDVSVADFHRYSRFLPPVLRKRTEHVVKECLRVKSAIVALHNGEMQKFGLLMNECHESLRDLYQVSCDELDVMVEIGQKIDGCYGARLTGAGFGGCTVNLVEGKKSEFFKNTLKKKYESITKKKAKVYICHASNGVEVMNIK